LEREYNFGCILKILNLCHCILNKNTGFSETGMYGFCTTFTGMLNLTDLHIISNGIKIAYDNKL